MVDILLLCLCYVFSHLEFMKVTVIQVSYGAGFIEFASEEAKRIYGDIIPAPLSDRRLFVLKQVNFEVYLVSSISYLSSFLRELYTL